MVVQGIGAGKAQVFLCREDIRVEGTGKASRLHSLYDWGATVTLVTHAAAEKAGLERRRQTPVAIAGLGGRCTMVDSFNMVPVVDGNDKVRVVKALGVDHITTLAATNVTEDIQGFGSGSAWIRINLRCWIRIRIRIEIEDPDPDPVGEKITPKIEKRTEFSSFEVLDVHF